MELIQHTHNNTALRPNVATIGFFDGVHCGHQFLIHQVVQLAQENGLASSVITFSQHPRRVMQQSYQPKLLTTLQEKCELLSKQALDYTVLLDFSMEMSRMTAREFMDVILKQQLGVRMLVIGYDHRFGHNRAEGFEDYVRYGQELGIQVVQSKAWQIGNINISSSVIRNLIQLGDVKQATDCLGCPYLLKGRIVAGHQVGRKMGFPTANIQVNNPFKIIPANGVYAVWATVDSQRYKGMLNIGNRPTVDNDPKNSIECYLLDFDGNIYNHEIEVEFVDYLRAEKRFDSLESLTHQLQQDAAYVATLLE